MSSSASGLRSDGPFERLISRMRVLRRCPSEDALRRAWQDAAATLHATGEEVDAYADELLMQEECPVPAHFASWLKARRGPEWKNPEDGLVHCYDRNDFEWLLPAAMVDNVLFITDEERRRRRPWRR